MTSDVTMSNPNMSEASMGEPPVKKRSSWPTVLGIIGCILASLGILSSTCSFFIPALLKSVSEQMPPEQQAQMMSEMPTGAFLYATIFVSLILSLLLLIGSIKLLKRKETCRTVLNGYAVASIVWFICSLVWQATVVHPEMKAKRAELVEAAQQQQDDQETSEAQGDSYAMEASEQMQDVSFYGGQACTGVLTIGWCALILVFMNGGRYRDEIESWVD
jgi:preprotein translocase subunit SecG